MWHYQDILMMNLKVMTNSGNEKKSNSSVSVQGLGGKKHELDELALQIISIFIIWWFTNRIKSTVDQINPSYLVLVTRQMLWADFLCSKERGPAGRLVQAGISKKPLPLLCCTDFSWDSQNAMEVFFRLVFHITHYNRHLIPLSWDSYNAYFFPL